MIKNIIAAFLTAVCLLSETFAAQNNGFFSNDVAAISGSHDSIAVLTCKTDNISNNMTFSISFITKIDSSYICNDANWKTIVFPKNQYPKDLAFGEGLSIVTFDTSSEKKMTLINEVYLINHETNTSSKFELPWNLIKTDSSKRLFAFSAAYLNGSFYLGCYDGGLVRWDVSSNKKSILLPGIRGAVTDTFKGISDTLKSITGVEAVNDFLVITTPENTWKYSPADSSWTATTNKSLDPNLSVFRFEYSFADPFSASHPLYSIAKVNYESKDTTVLCKFIRADSDSGWKVLIDKEISGFTFGSNGYFYSFFVHDSTNCEVYRDTLGDSSVPGQPFNPVNANSYYIPGRLVRSSDIPGINDFQFIKTTDTSGILWIGTTDGLFLSQNEIPGVSQSQFIRIKRVLPVKSSLKEAFACPGILKYDDSDPLMGHVKFVYNLSKDAKVTIKIYDFNMDLVKTVIDKKLRTAGTANAEIGRSNNKKEDIWDGTTQNGRPCAPGVYYFKISTDIGEHAFGKIVVAK